MIVAPAFTRRRLHNHETLALIKACSMPTLTLSPKHNSIQTYYRDLHQLSLLYHTTEGGVSPAFATLLRHCASQCHWTLAEQYPLKRGQSILYPDGALLDTFRLVHGWWEAKDTQDDLAREA